MSLNKDSNTDPRLLERSGIVVLGMHRSGTSAVARVLGLLGADLPRGSSYERADNPTGFWESWRAQQLNDELFVRLGSAWDSLAPLPDDWMEKAEEWGFVERAIDAVRAEFGQSLLFALKDPRVCVLFPLWRQAIEQVGARPKVIIPLRNPFEVADSLSRRDSFLAEKGLLLWLNHVLAAERETRDLSRVFVTFPALLEDWRLVTGAIATALDIIWPNIGDASAAQIDAFLDAGMRHQRSDDKELVLNEGMRSWVGDVYRALLELTRDAYDKESIAVLDQISGEIAAVEPLYRDGFAKLAVSEKKFHQASRDIAAAKADLYRVTEQEKTVRGHLAALQTRFTEMAWELDNTRVTEGQLARRLSELQTSVAWGVSAPVKVLEDRYPDIVRKAYTLPKMLGWVFTGRLAQNRVLRHDAAAIIGSGVFNENDYLHRYPGVALTGYSPLYHWLLLGNKEGKNPHPLFFTSWYLDTYPQVTESGKDPLVDYLTIGCREGRDPCPLFNGQYYIKQDDRLLECNSNLLVHYLQSGAYSGMNPNEFFDSRWYLDQNPDVAELGTNPLLHYVQYGANEGRDPHPYFANNWYLEEYRDSIPSGMNPLVHFLTVGMARGLTTHPDGYFSDLMGADGLPEDATDSSYIDQVLSLPSRQHANFRSYRKYDKEVFDIRLIAFYLPQFHPIPENDEWWGRGFTEWSNVSKAVPQFVGHDQPKLPAELGYYDLRLPEVQARQVELAVNYGLAGFCFHYYWFAGRKLLDRPLNQFLENKALDFGFCVSWANENWTRSWDGLDKEILVEQRHSSQDDIDFIREMEPLFRDDRYIRVAGRPLLLVYRVAQLPDPAGTAERWRQWCIKAGLGNPYLAFVRFDDTDPTLLGFDAAVEFPPHKIGGRLPPMNPKLRFFHEDYQGTVLSYDGMVQRALRESVPTYPLLRGVCPGWDNEARRPGKGLCFYGATPPKYQAWLEEACSYADNHPVEGERLVFVNAWNEWAEGAYIEPDRSFGYAYLDATRSALRQWSKA